MKKLTAILGVVGGVILAGVGVNALCKKKANDECEDEYIVDDEVESDDSAEEAAE